MKNITKFGIVAGFFVIGAVFLFSNPVQAGLSSGEAIPSDEQASGKHLYGQYCASCHGLNGKAQTTQGKRLEADDISGGTSAATTIRVVTNGKKKMPSFKKRLNGAQISAIAQYVHGL